jgi:DNA-binding NarL/FixJ family response regulator
MPLTVAIVDDNPILRKSLSQLINATDACECIGLYVSVEEALAGVAAHQPDLLLMDIELPQMNGIEGTRRLKAAHPGMDIVMLTVFADPEKILDSILAGASGYLLKKTPPDRIIEAIHDIRKGGSSMSPGVARTVIDTLRGWNAKTPAADGGILTEREREVLEGIADGKSYNQVAAALFISVDTVRTYIRRIYEKLQVHTKTAAIAEARKRGLL